MLKLRTKIKKLVSLLLISLLINLTLFEPAAVYSAPPGGKAEKITKLKEPIDKLNTKKKQVGSGIDYAPGEIIVKFKENADKTAIHKSAKTKVKKELKQKKHPTCKGG